MRCEEVIRELAVPTGERGSNALSEHLAHCPSCAAWAQRSAALDSLWDETRPPEPSEQVWDALWERVVASLETSQARTVYSSVSSVPSANGSTARPRIRLSDGARQSPRVGRRTWALIGIVGLAQAAAVLVAAGLTWREFGTSGPRQGGPATGSVAATPSRQPFNQAAGGPSVPAVEVDEGHLVVIVIPTAEQKPVVVDRTPERMFSGVFAGIPDDWYLAYNAAEALDSHVVAMKE
jgi:hypothetical protein